jgi:hypothetical protein
MQDKASDKLPSDKPSKATELDDGALETVVGGCQISPGGLSTQIPGPSTGGTSTAPPIEGGGLGGKGTSTPDPSPIRFPR